MADTCSVKKRDAQALGALIGFAIWFLVAVVTGTAYAVLFAAATALAGSIIMGLVIDGRRQPGQAGPVPSDPLLHERSTSDSAPSTPPPARSAQPPTRPQRKLLRRSLDVALRVVGIIALLGGLIWGGIAAYEAIKPEPELRVVERIVVADHICMDGTVEPGRGEETCFGHGGLAARVSKDRLEGRPAILWYERPDHNEQREITEFGP